MDRGELPCRYDGQDHTSSQGFGTLLTPVPHQNRTHYVSVASHIHWESVGIRKHRLAAVLDDLLSHQTARINLRETSDRVGETEGEVRRILRKLRALGVIAYAPWFTEPRVLIPDWKPRAIPGGQTWQTISVTNGPHSNPPSTSDN